jgi:hypothetical protein
MQASSNQKVIEDLNSACIHSYIHTYMHSCRVCSSHFRNTLFYSVCFHFFPQVSLEARVRKTADAATLNSSAINPVTSSAICSRSSSTSLQQESVGPVARLSIPRRFVGASTSTPLGDGDSHCNLQHRVVMGRRELNALVAMLQS